MLTITLLFTITDVLYRDKITNTVHTRKHARARTRAHTHTQSLTSESYIHYIFILVFQFSPVQMKDSFACLIPHIKENVRLLWSSCEKLLWLLKTDYGRKNMTNTMSSSFFYTSLCSQSSCYTFLRSQFFCHTSLRS